MHFPITRASRPFVAMAMASMYVLADSARGGGLVRFARLFDPLAGATTRP